MLDQEELQNLADSQIEHVLLALRTGDRGYNVRDVLDPWWCFERGAPFVRSGRNGNYTAIQFNKPCAWQWRDVLPKFDWYSGGAQEIVELGEVAKILDRKTHPAHVSLVVDHSVPLARICEELWSSPALWKAEFVSC
jgi:hypothetical protein